MNRQNFRFTLDLFRTDILVELQVNSQKSLLFSFSTVKVREIELNQNFLFSINLESPWINKQKRVQDYVTVHCFMTCTGEFRVYT